MAKQIALAARVRAGSGKSEARKLRRAGRVPAIAYGVGLDPTPLSVDALELFRVLNTGAGSNAVISLGMDSGGQLVLAREIRRHPVRREILHVDFVAVQRNVKVEVAVPIALEGDAPGADQGGVVSQELYTVHVSVLPLDVPEQIVCDVSQMEIGDVKRLGDLSLPDGVELVDDPERAVVSVITPTAEEPEEAGDLAAEDAEVQASGETSVGGG